MKSLLSIILIALVTLAFTTCGENALIPPEQKPPKNPFEMTWTIDTISYPGSMQTMMNSMWASSPNDVWICGHNETSRGVLFHYDGNKWMEVNPMVGDIMDRSKTLHKIMGTAANNLWAIGDGSPNAFYNYKDLILSYDGTKWKEHKQYLKLRPISLFVSKTNEVWIGCDSAVVLHYDGVKWEKDKPKLNVPEGSDFFINGIVQKEGVTYLNVAIYDIRNKRYLTYFVKGTINNWSVVDTMYQENPSTIKWGTHGFRLGLDSNIYSFGSWGIYSLEGVEWKHLFKTNFLTTNIFSLNTTYKIAVGNYGNIGFYNGLDWKLLNNLPPPAKTTNLYDVWTDGQEIFIIGFTGSTWPTNTVILHGK